MKSSFIIKIDYKFLKEDILNYLCRADGQQKNYEQMDRLANLEKGTFESWALSEKPILWSDFYQLLRLCGIEMSFALINGYHSKNLQDIVPFLNFMSQGLTQEEFCQRIDISRATVNRWLAGKAEPTVEMVFQVLNNYRAYLFPFLAAHFPVENFSSTEKFNEKMKLLYEVCFKQKYGIYAIFYMLSNAFNVNKAKPAEVLSKAFKISLAEAENLYQQIIDSRAIIPSENTEGFQAYLINVPIVFSPKSADENCNRILSNFNFFLEILGRESIITGHARVFRRVDKIPESLYLRCEDIVRGTYQKIWHVIYNENLIDSEVEYESQYPENERITLMGIFGIQDYSDK